MPMSSTDDHDESTDLEQEECAGVLLLEPEQPGLPWRMIEISAPVDFFVGVGDGGGQYPSLSQAVAAAHDLLVLTSEGRLPAMHEHVQQSVREFVRTLEERGYDRETALKLLLDMVDRQATLPPKAVRPGRDGQRRAG